MFIFYLSHRTWFSFSFIVSRTEESLNKVDLQYPSDSILGSGRKYFIGQNLPSAIVLVIIIIIFETLLNQFLHILLLYSSVHLCNIDNTLWTDTWMHFAIFHWWKGERGCWKVFSSCYDCNFNHLFVFQLNAMRNVGFTVSRCCHLVFQSI